MYTKVNEIPLYHSQKLQTSWSLTYDSRKQTLIGNCGFLTFWFTSVISVLHELIHVVLHREHDQVHWKSWQPAFSYSYDHTWPGEWGQGLAPGEEPWARRPEGGRPRQQDGLWDLPDKTSGYQGEPSVLEKKNLAFNVLVLSGDLFLMLSCVSQFL